MRNAEAAKAATQHLIAAGRRRIAVLGVHEGERVGSAALRLQGHREALEEAGIEFDERLMGPVDRWHRLDGAETMRAILASGVQFDAVFGFNDTLALGAMRVLQEAGLRVPQDVAVMGFDGLDEAKYSLPTLSTVDPGRDEIADRAVAVLADRIENRGKPYVPQQHLTRFTVIGRESTAVS
jgi:DNA-binding LacI/PurR family transcriptional regulator